MIIDPTYFDGKIFLPQVSNTEGAAQVQQFIDSYEPTYLQEVLGYDLWKAFAAGIEGSGTADERWQDLLTGKEFTRNGQTYKWAGFEAAITPLAQYVYCQVMENNASYTTLNGEARTASDNTLPVNPTEKITAAWNEMVRMNLLLYGFLSANAAVYPEWKPSRDVYWCHSYRGWRCDEDESLFSYKNRFGI